MKSIQFLLCPVFVLGTVIAASTVAAAGTIRAGGGRRRNLETATPSFCPSEKYPNYYSLKVDGTTHYMLGRPGNFGNVETSDSVSIWEEWYLIRNCDGTTSIQSKKHNTFISANPNAAVVAADIGSNNVEYDVKLIKDGNDESTKFDMVVQAQNKETGNLIVTFQSRSRGTYLSASNGQIIQVGTTGLVSRNEYWEIDDLVEDQPVNYDLYPACAGNTLPSFDPYNTYFAIGLNGLFIIDEKDTQFFLSGDWGRNVKVVNYVSDWEEWYLLPNCVDGTYSIKSKQHNTYLSVDYEGQVDLSKFNNDFTRFFIHADEEDGDSNINVIKLESAYFGTYVSADPTLPNKTVNAGDSIADSYPLLTSWQVIVISDTE